MSEQNAGHPSERRLLVAVFRDHDGAARAVERLIERDFPMDGISLLGREESAGDDVLGIYYVGVGERMKAWAGQGAFWGGLWGALASAAGMFLIPGLGAVFAVGPVVEALAAVAASAAVAGGAMAGAAAISQLAVALHRMGVPEERLQSYHDAIDKGHYVVLLRCSDPREVERHRTELGMWGAEAVEDFAYR